METVRNWVIVAQILRPQGRKGELLAELHTDFPERFKSHRRVFLSPSATAEFPSTSSETEVLSYWLPVGRNHGRIVLQLSGIDTIDKAKQIIGYQVLIPQEERLPLSDGSIYISELVGCTVYDKSNVVGTIEQVQFPTTSDGLRRFEDVPPILVVSSPQKDELLIPFAKDLIISINTTQKRVEMKLPPGLTNINR